MTKRIDFVRLVKLMARTDSSNDHEALACIRKSNRLLREHGNSWPELLLRLIDRMIKDEGEKAAKELDAQAILEQTLTFLKSNGKISEAMHTSLVKMVRLMFRSKDENFLRRGQRRINEIMSRMHVTRVVVDD